ncbi:MAG TPA: urea carboxylase-associated family protein [bacterium]|nr:urea carboxylase-associated family protein [bacterium]
MEHPGITRSLIAFEETLPPRGATAFPIKAGQVCRIVDLEGQQVADFICFNLNDYTDKLSPENTQSLNGTLLLTTGHTLYSTKATQLMTITADTCGTHDLIAGSCSDQTNAFRYGVRGTPNCRSNFERVLRPYGIPLAEVPYSFNVFMNVPVAPDGRTAIQEPTSKPGDYCDLRANLDLLIAVSNCPQERNPCNAFNPTKLQVVVYEMEPTGKGAPVQSSVTVRR